MIVSNRIRMANGVLSPLLQTTLAGLLVLPALFAVPAIADSSLPAAQKQTLPNSSSGSDAMPDSAVPGQTAPMPILIAPATSGAEKGELRGMWVVRDSMTSPANVHQVVVTAVKYHLNALFIQVRGRGDAWYNSPYEPRAEGLARQPLSFDPLTQVVAEAHANGIQVHAWMNTFLTWSGARRPYSPSHLWNAHPDWFATDRNGHCSPIGTDACEGVFLQPSNPKVQDHLFQVYTDVASRYDVDGIHFDYCRYAGANYDFSGPTLGRFRDYIASEKPESEVAAMDIRQHSDRLAFVHAYGREWADWRRAQISNLVARISTAVKAEKPWMQVSAAVFPDADEAFAVRGQDWRGWLKSGALDAVALMAYNASTQRVLQQTRRAIAAAGGKQVYTGIGAWHLSAHDVAHKIAEVRKAGANGVNLFSYGGVHTRLHYLDTLARGVFASRSAPPRMRWLPSRGGSVNRSAVPGDAVPAASGNK